MSNRLPITVSKGSNGNYTFRKSSGGLVSALEGVQRDKAFEWMGWPGLDVNRQDQDHFEAELRNRFGCYPVFLNENIADDHYNGYSNA